MEMTAQYAPSAGPKTLANPKKTHNIRLRLKIAKTANPSVFHRGIG
jgi:hypothetical protein